MLFWTRKSYVISWLFFATFLRSINGTCESNENGQFSAQLGRAKLMSAREIEDAVFLADTKIFEERKTHGVFTFTKAYMYAKVRRI